MEKRITIGSDHAGYALKIKIIAHLKEIGWDVIDVGTDSEASCDYPVFADAVCKNIQNGTTKLGILICGTGIGMSMAANKHKGIRAAACENTYSSRMTRAHNDSNVLCMGARVVGPGLAAEILHAFLDTDFEGGRHQRRIDMIAELEKKPE